MQLERERQRICHGITFSPHADAPSLRLREGHQWVDEPLQLERSFSLRVGQDKWCLGYVTMDTVGQREHHPCQRHQVVRTGTQCALCRRLDQTKFMHQFHKTGEAPAGLRAYLQQPHFLYVASFANGASKVGTTSTQSKWTRLATQGAVSARYIARALDGAAIRVLEDLVTEHCGLRQQVRQKAKVQGLAAWDYTANSLDELNATQAQHAAEFLAKQRGLSSYGVELLDERWEQPKYAAAVIRAWDRRSIHPWATALPGSLTSIRVRGVLGQSLLVEQGLDDQLSILNAAELKTRALQLGTPAAESAPAQIALF